MATDQRKKNRVKHLKVDEVSVVDNPANAGARFVLMKRDTRKSIRKDEEEITDEELDSLEQEIDELEMSMSGADEDSDDADDSDDDADDDSDEDDLDDEDDSDDDDSDEDDSDEDYSDDDDSDEPVEKAHTLFNGTRAKSSLWPMVDALRESVSSILGDEEANSDVKKTAIQKTTRQFAQHLASMVDDVDDADTPTVTKRGDDMNGSVKINKRVRDRLTKLHDENIELNERLAKMEDERATERAEREARSIIGKNASKDDLADAVAVLKSGDEASIKLLKRLAKQNQELMKETGLFDELGSSRGTPVAGSGSAAAEQLAEEFRKNNPSMSRPESIAKAYESLGDEAYLADDDTFVDD